MATPSDLVRTYRSQYPDDPRSDAEILSIFGDVTPYPTEESVATTAPEGAFAPDPGLGRSFRGGLESGTYGLGSTIASAGALAVDWLPGTFADPLRNRLLRTGENLGGMASEAAQQAPVREIENIQNFGDFANWAAYGIGSAAPSLGEALATSAIGGLAGTAATAETGPGAVAGGIGGAALGFIERRAVKKLIQEGVEELVGYQAKKISRDALSDATKKLVRDKMMSVAGSIGTGAAGGINSWGLSSGEIYGDLLKNGNIDPDSARNYATGLGAIAAAPDTILPSYLWGRFFDKPLNQVSKEEAKDAGNFLLRFMMNTGEDAVKQGAIEGSTEAFQEWVNIAAEHWADPTSARGGFEISDDEWSRIRNAAAIGAISTVAPAAGAGLNTTLRDRAVAPAIAAEEPVVPPIAAPVAEPTIPTPEPVVPEPVPVVETLVTPVAEAPVEVASTPVVTEEVLPPATPVPVVEEPISQVAPVAPVSAEHSVPVVTPPAAEPAPLPGLTETPAAPSDVFSGSAELTRFDKPASAGTLLAYGSETGVSSADKVGKPTLTRQVLITRNPDGTLNANGVYPVPQKGNKAAIVRVHEGGTSVTTVTTADIVADTGLSKSTVDKARAGYASIAQETRDKVAASMERLSSGRKQNSKIQDFVQGKEVVGFMKMSIPAEDIRRTFANEQELASVVGQLTEAKEAQVQAKKEVAKRKELGLTAGDFVGSLSRSGTRGATAAALLNAAVSEITGRTTLSEKEALYSLLSQKALSTPDKLVDAVESFGSPQGTRGARLLGLFSPKELSSVLDMSPEAAVTRLRAAILADQADISIDDAQALLDNTLSTDRREEVMGKVRSITSENEARWANKFVVLGQQRLGLKRRVSYDEGGAEQGDEEAGVDFVAPREIEEAAGTVPSSAHVTLRINENELLVAREVFSQLDGQTINQNNRKEVLDFVEEFKSRLAGIARQKQFKSLNLFSEGKLEDPAFVGDLLVECMSDTLRTRSVPTSFRVTDAYIRKAFNGVVDYLGRMRADVRLVQGVVDRTSEMLQHEQGKVQFDKATGKVLATIALNDLANPTLHNLRALMHETAHIILRNSEAWEKRALGDAITTAVNGGELRRASNDPRLQSLETALRSGLTKEQYLEERLVEHLTALGMDRVNSQSVIQRLLMAVRRVMSVAAENLMRAFGYETLNNERILSFVEREFTAVVDGALAPRSSLLEYLGVSRRSPESKALYMSTSTEGVMSQTYDPTTGELSAERMLVADPVAVGANVEQTLDRLSYISNKDLMTADSQGKKLEIGIGTTIPGQSTLPANWLVTVFNYGDDIPVAVQIDEMTGDENTASYSPSQLTEMGYYVPDFTTLPTGQYSVPEAMSRVPETMRTEQRKILRSKFRVLRTLDDGTIEVFGEFDTLRQARMAAVKDPALNVELDNYINGGEDPSNALLTKLAPVIAGIEEIVGRLTGGRARVHLVKDMSVEEANYKVPEDRQSLNGLSHSDIIALNTTAMSIYLNQGDVFSSLGTASHESWHFLADQGFLSPEENKLLTKALPELRKFLSGVFDEGTVQALPDDEVLAFSFGEYAKLVMAGRPGDFPNIPSRTIFEKVVQFFRELGAKLKSLGFNSVEDFTVKNIFYKAWSGEMASRVPTASRNILFSKADNIAPNQSSPLDSRVRYDLEVLAATINSIETELNKAYGPLLNGRTLDSYFDKVLGLGSKALPIEDMKAALVANLAKHGVEPGSVNIKMSLDGVGDAEITNPYMRTEVSNELYRTIHALHKKIITRRQAEDRELREGLKKNIARKERFLKRIGDYNNAETLLRPVVAELSRLVSHITSDIQGGESTKVVTEAIRELMGYDVTGQELGTDSIPTILKAFSWMREADGRNLMDAITAISRVGLDYSANPSVNRDKLRTVNTELLNDLTDGSPYSNARLGVLLTLAKNEPELFGLARLRVERDPTNKRELGALLNEALAGGNARWSKLLLSKRAEVGGAPYSRDLLRDINKLRRKLISEYDSFIRREKNLPSYDKAAKVLDETESRLQVENGFSLADSPIIDGSEIFHVTNSSANRDEVIQSTRKITVTGESAYPEMWRVVLDNTKWLESYTGNKDAVYLKVQQQTKKLTTMLTNRIAKKGKRVFALQFIQSISDRLQDTGLPIARDLGRMLNRFADLFHSNVDRVTEMGNRFNKLYAACAAEYGMVGNSEDFRVLLMNPAYAFIESRPDILDKTELYNRLRASLMESYPATKKLMEEHPKGFDKLIAVLEANSAAWTEMRKLADSWGVLVEDSGLKIYNPVTGVEEPVLRAGQAVSTLMAPRTTHRISQIVEQMREVWSQDSSFALRFIADRYLGKDLTKNQALQRQLSKLTQSGKDEVLANLNRFMAENPAGRDGLSKSLKPYFTDTIIADFVIPLVRKAGDETFKAPDGTFLETSVVQSAWNLADNDVVTFAENLFTATYEAAEGASDETVNEARAQYVADIIGTFSKYFKTIDKMVGKVDDSTSFLGGDAVRHSLMDSRKATVLPVEWVDYGMAVPEALHITLRSLATHATMGRDMNDFYTGLRKVNQNIDRAKLVLKERRRAVRQASPAVLNSRQVERAVISSFVNPEEYKRLRALEKNQNNISEIENQIDAWMHVQSHPDHDVKIPLAVVRGIAGMMVNNWRTFLYNANALLSPFMTYGFSKTAISQFLNNLKYTANQAAGTLFSAFGKQLDESAAERLFREESGMFIDPEVYADMYGRWANPGVGGNYESDTTGKTVARIRKTVDTLTNIGWGGNSRYAKLRPFGALNMGNIWFKRALMRGQLRSVSKLLEKAVGYLNDNPEVVTDPNFRFTPELLGYKDKLGLDERRAFEGLVAALERSGYPLEVLARESLKRSKTPGFTGALLTRDQTRAVMARALDELSLESTISNTPIWTTTNNFAKAAMPLLTWPLNQTNAVLKSFLTPEGQLDLRAARYGIKGMLIAIMPLSLAYTLLMDEWDEEVLGRKGNLSPLSLDQGFGSFAGASVERLARMGTFGLAGDLVNGFRVFGTDGDLRGLSFDQRVLFMNTFLSATKTISTLVQQGPSNLTYESFYRPLSSSLGMGQAIQYMQLINNYGNTVAGVQPFTREAEALNRMNVKYYLAGAGRILGMEVRGSRGGGGTTNSVRPWVTRMAVAAMADDKSEFSYAYKNAVMEAKNNGQEDPEEYVKRSYAYSNPLRSTFKTPPSEEEFAKLLGTLTSYGRESVLSSLRHFNTYGESIGVRPYTGSNKSTEKSTNKLDRGRQAAKSIFNSELFQ